MSASDATFVLAGLKHLVGLEDGGTPEQRRLLRVLGVHFLGLAPHEIEGTAPMPPRALSDCITDAALRRRFLQLSLMLGLSRHPRTESQLERMEAVADALDFEGEELRMVEALFHRSAAEATGDFLRSYGPHMPELSEPHGVMNRDTGQLEYDDDFFEKVRTLGDSPVGSLGWCFARFYERNRLTLPGRHTPNPGYYVCHDMNHVISGYEATGPGEIALGAFKLALCDSEANWMASLTNFLIHEVGLFMHGTDLQFIPYGKGGEPYHGVDGKRGALDLPGAAELLAEAWHRGAACSGDFSLFDHLEMALVPIEDIRRQFNVIPLEKPMFDDGFWPRPSHRSTRG